MVSRPALLETDAAHLYYNISKFLVLETLTVRPAAQPRPNVENEMVTLFRQHPFRLHNYMAAKSPFRHPTATYTYTPPKWTIRHMA